jgi:hypothetical protein
MIIQGLNSMFCSFCRHKLCNLCIRKELYGGRNQDIFLFLSTLNQAIVMLNLKNEICPVWILTQQNIRCFLVVHVLVFYITYIWKFTQYKGIKTFTRAVSQNLTARIYLKHNLDFEEVHLRWEKCSQFLSWRWRRSGNISVRKITHIIGEYLGQMNGRPF